MVFIYLAKTIMKMVVYEEVRRLVLKETEKYIVNTALKTASYHYHTNQLSLKTGYSL